MKQNMFTKLRLLLEHPHKSGALVANAVNKRYYQEVEDYDWVAATDRLIGLESYFHRRRQKVILHMLKKYQKGGRMIDIGCGTGLILRHLPKGAVGVDINPRNIQRAKKHAPHATVVVCDIEENIPFSKKTFVTAICTDVLEHLVEPEQALKQIQAVLRDDGLLVGTVPGRSLIWRFRFLSSTRPKEPFHRHFTLQEAENLLVANKFRPIYMQYHIFAMEIVFVAKKIIHHERFK